MSRRSRSCSALVRRILDVKKGFPWHDDSSAIKMPKIASCSNCCSKFGLFNKEYSCSSCHFVLCKKCLVLCNSCSQPCCMRCAPASRTNPNDHYCPKCFSALSRHNAKHVPVPPATSHASTSSTANWWGEGLPPPSMRNVQKPVQWERTINPQVRNEAPTQISHDDLMKKLETVRRIDNQPQRIQTASLSELEERLAAVRGCDVELVRKPRIWFDDASSPSAMPNCDTADQLMKICESQIRIEDNIDRALEERYHRARGAQSESSCAQEEPPRDSVVSVDTEFSEATAEEMKQINELMADAEKRSKEAPEPRPTDADVSKEARHVLARTRQASIDINKVNAEIANFYESRLDEKFDDEKSSSTESLSDERLREIIAEAEKAEDMNTHNEVTEEMPARHSKKGFLGSIFKKSSDV